MEGIRIYHWVSIGLAILVLLFGSGWLVRFRRRKSQSQNGTGPLAIRKRSYCTTVPVNVGDFVEFLWFREKVRVSVLGIVKEKFEFPTQCIDCDGAELKVNFGGILVFGGEGAKRTDTNQFKIPFKDLGSEELSSIFHFYVSDNSFSFFRVNVDHINTHSKVVTLNLFFHRG